MNKEEKNIERILARLGTGSNPKRALKDHEVAEGLAGFFENAGALLEDARLLAKNNRKPRALSLTILALEELAKIPDLYQQFLNLTLHASGESWKDFWNRFNQHKPKQKMISSYGNMLKEQSGATDTIISNPTPYANYLSESSYGHLDNVKQKQFYVDFIGNRFHIPSASKDVDKALDKLFAFAEERHESFSSWHISAQRSLDFIAARSELLTTKKDDIEEIFNKIFSLNAWASTSTQEEMRGDLMRILCYHSSANIPDYATFIPSFEHLAEKWTPSEVIALLSQVVPVLKYRMEIEQLPLSRFRAFLMFKLLLSYANKNCKEKEVQKVFGITPSPEMKAHFGE